MFGAPEQVAALAHMGDADALSEKMDTYCLASTMLYALVGEAHFPGVDAKTPFEMVEALDQRASEPLSDEALPDLTGRPRKLLSEAFRRWLVRDPDERPSAGELADEIEVLLARRREQEREAERAAARQKASLARFRLATVAVLAVIAAAGVWAYSKRKTLTLAAKLQKAEQEGAARFEELGECKTAYNHEHQQHRECDAQLERAVQRYQTTLANVRAGSKQAKTQLQTDLTRTRTKLEGCETKRSELEDAKTTCEDANTSLEGRVSELEDARNRCESTSQQLSDEHARCVAELASCRAQADPDAAPPPSSGDSIYDGAE